MTKLQLTIGLGAAVLLTSCEPLPVYPENTRPPRRGIYDDRNDSYERQDRRYDRRPYGQDRYDDRFENPDRRPAPPVQRQPTRDQYPMAERTANPNQVLSPYAPYNVIDVEDFRSGQLAKDPSNGKIFRVP